MVLALARSVAGFVLAPFGEVAFVKAVGASLDLPRAGRPSLRGHAHELTVSEVVRETSDAVTITFDLPDQLAGRLDRRCGQFVTVHLGHPDDPGRTIARCYSICTPIGSDDPVSITVKRVSGGLASNWLVEHARPGLRLAVSSPGGRFMPRSLATDAVLVAAGSGITPIRSILETMLRDSDNEITLVYANRDASSVIFRERIGALVGSYPERLRYVEWLESDRGLPDAESLAELIGDLSAEQALICGPAVFMALAQDALVACGVAPEAILTEEFRTPEAPVRAAGASDAGPGVAVTATYRGTRTSFEWKSGTVLLDGLLDNGVDVPFVCRSGICGGCAGLVTAGEVGLKSNDYLAPEEIEGGWRLTCQSLPVSEKLEIDFDAS